MESNGTVVKAADRTRPLADRLGRLAGLVLDALYPPLCLGCDTPIASAHAVCGTCFAQLRPITAPFCPRLGIPFAAALGPDALSAEAIADPPPFGRARAALIYTPLAGRLVSRLKYGDRPELARFCARLMVSAGADLWADRPVLVPVPLHPLRQVRRGYNQSLELARAISRLTGLPLDAGLISRVRNTRPQVGLSGEGRHRNLSGAFKAREDGLVRIRGRGVVIVDDVLTTGSTVKAATRALKRIGIETIDVVTFARVVIGDHAHI